jgi:hypothetical protein
MKADVIVFVSGKASLAVAKVGVAKYFVQNLNLKLDLLESVPLPKTLSCGSPSESGRVNLTLELLIQQDFFLWNRPLVGLELMIAEKESFHQDSHRLLDLAQRPEMTRSQLPPRHCLPCPHFPIW